MKSRMKKRKSFPLDECSSIEIIYSIFCIIFLSSLATVNHEIDRTRAALWLQKLRGIKKDEHLKLRNEHLKLFLFALHRRSLCGVFEAKPPKEDLETFHDGLTLLEMTRELIEITERKKTESKKEGEEGFGLCPLPPVRTNFSYDLKEYAACQEIPKFGCHVFYAVSNEPIQLWNKAVGENYPGHSEPPNQLQWELSMAKICDHVLEREAELNAAIDAERQAEIGFVFEEKEVVKEKPLEIDVQPCGNPKAGAEEAKFRWKSDSKLLIFQTYDFSDVGIAEDLIGQGKYQLELDEHALNVLDESLPGRQRVHIRIPYYQGLPPDFLERRHHGVYEPSIDDECDGPPCEDEFDEEEDEGEDEDQEECDDDELQYSNQYSNYNSYECPGSYYQSNIRSQSQVQSTQNTCGCSQQQPSMVSAAAQQLQNLCSQQQSRQKQPRVQNEYPQQSNTQRSCFQQQPNVQSQLSQKQSRSLNASPQLSRVQSICQQQQQQQQPCVQQQSRAQMLCAQHLSPQQSRSQSICGQQPSAQSAYAQQSCGCLAQNTTGMQQSAQFRAPTGYQSQNNQCSQTNVGYSNAGPQCSQNNGGWNMSVQWPVQQGDGGQCNQWPVEECTCSNTQSFNQISKVQSSRQSRNCNCQ